MRKNRYLERLDLTVMRHIVRIFELPKNTSYKRIRIVLGEPEIYVRLSIRLLKVYHKYKMHFKEEATKYRKQLMKYFSVEEIDNEKIEYNKKKEDMAYSDLNDTIKLIYDGKYIIRNGHKNFLKKHLYNDNNLGDYNIIRFLTGVTRAKTVSSMSLWR
jgi:hypothetical protein